MRDKDVDPALLVAAMESAKSWRARRELLEDEDFAFYFDDYDQAYEQAGLGVAEMWQQIRAEQDIGLAGAAVAAYELQEANSRIARGRGPQLLEAEDLEAGGVRLRPNARFARGPIRQVDKRIERELISKLDRKTCDALFDCMWRTGALGGVGSSRGLDDAMYRRAVERRVQEAVRAAEPETLRRAVITWDEFQQFARRQQVNPSEVTRIALEEFVHTSDAPSRCFTAVRWLAKNLEIPWPATQIKPKVGRRKDVLGFGQNQAPCAEPIMITELERAVLNAYRSGNPVWRALLSQWLQIWGLRLKHLKRSVVIRASEGWVHFRCRKGKQLRHRSGFDWAAPAHFITQNFNWWQEMFAADWVSMSDQERRKAGLVYDSETRRPLSDKAVIECVREAFRGIVENSADISTYTWRRVSSTVGERLDFSDTHMLALSDWQNRTAGNAPMMPLRYSTAKYLGSMRAKADVFSALTKICGSTSWESVPESTWEQIKGAAGSEAIWLMESDKESHFKSRDFSLTFVSRRFMVKRGQSETREAMPVIPGRQLAGTMRDGARLCTAFS